MGPSSVDGTLYSAPSTLKQQSSLHKLDIPTKMAFQGVITNLPNIFSTTLPTPILAFLTGVLITTFMHWMPCARLLPFLSDRFEALEHVPANLTTIIDKLNNAPANLTPIIEKLNHMHDHLHGKFSEQDNEGWKKLETRVDALDANHTASDARIEELVKRLDAMEDERENESAAVRIEMNSLTSAVNSVHALMLALQGKAPEAEKESNEDGDTNPQAGMRAGESGAEESPETMDAQMQTETPRQAETLEKSHESVAMGTQTENVGHEQILQQRQFESTNAETQTENTKPLELSEIKIHYEVDTGSHTSPNSPNSGAEAPQIKTTSISTQTDDMAFQALSPAPTTQLALYPALYLHLYGDGTDQNPGLTAQFDLAQKVIAGQDEELDNLRASEMMLAQQLDEQKVEMAAQEQELQKLRPMEAELDTLRSSEMELQTKERELKELKKKTKKMENELEEKDDELAGLKIEIRGLKVEMDTVQGLYRDLIARDMNGDGKEDEHDGSIFSQHYAKENAERDAFVLNQFSAKSEEKSGGPSLFGQSSQIDGNGPTFSFTLKGENRDENGMKKDESKDDGNASGFSFTNGGSAWKAKGKEKKQDAEENMFSFKDGGRGLRSSRFAN